MGYQTDFTVCVIENDATTIDLDKELGAVSGYYFDHGQLFASKWYDHEDNMRLLSCKYPNTVFLVEGEGEESGDLWKKYFKGGKMQRVNAEIVYAPYDEDLLK